MSIETILTLIGAILSSGGVLAIINFVRDRIARRDNRNLSDDERQAQRSQSIEARRENELSETRQELRNRVAQLERRVEVLETEVETSRESSIEARLLVAQYRAELGSCQATCRVLETELKRALDRVELLTPKPPIAGGAEGEDGSHESE